MEVAVIGGDFRSLILASKLKRDLTLILFVGEKIRWFLSGVNIFNQDLDAGPQYLDNFDNNDRLTIEEYGEGSKLIDLKFSYSNFIKGKMCSENMALPSWYNVFSTNNKLRSFQKEPYFIYKIPEKTFNSLQEYFAEVGGPTLLEEQKKICDKFYNFDTSNMDYLAKSIIPLCSDRQAVFEGEAANKLKKSHDSLTLL